MNDDAPATKADLNALRSELKADFNAAMLEMRDYLDERTRDLQTELLRAFADFSNSANVRFSKLEADTSNIDTRPPNGWVN